VNDEGLNFVSQLISVASYRSMFSAVTDYGRSGCCGRQITELMSALWGKADILGRSAITQSGHPHDQIHQSRQRVSGHVEAAKEVSSLSVVLLFPKRVSPKTLLGSIGILAGQWSTIVRLLLRATNGVAELHRTGPKCCRAVGTSALRPAIA